MTDKDKVIKDIVSEIPDANISEQELKEILKKNSMDMARILGDLAKKIDREGNPDEKKKVEITGDEQKNNEKLENMVFGKKTNNKAQVRYHRIVELPRGGNSLVVNRHIQRMKKIDELNAKMAQEEMSHPLQQDEIFKVITDPKENFLESIQNSIGNNNEYKNKLKVMKGLRKGQQPSLELRQIPI